VGYADWYDNSAVDFDPLEIVEANTPEEAIASSCNQGVGESSDVVVTEATADQNGLGNSPSRHRESVLTPLPAGQSSSRSSGNLARTEPLVGFHPFVRHRR
jgi:hypothetical protein